MGTDQRRVMMAECGRCGKRKPSTDFGVDNSQDNGLRTRCKACMLELRPRKRPEGWIRKTADMKSYQAAYRLANPKKIREYEKHRQRDPKIERHRAREKYEKRMKALHGPEWTPRKQAQTPEEKEAQRKKRNRDLSKAKAMRAKTDPVLREKVLARKAVQKAVGAGRLVRQPCVVCGEPDTHGHHEDYSKRLDVVWLCKKHHDEAHAKAVKSRDE